MTKRKKLPSQEFLNSILDYDAGTGTLTWKKRGSVFITQHGWSNNVLAVWNARYSGNVVNKLIGAGYIAVTVLGKAYLAHRIIWKMVYGVDPDSVDHIDGSKTNNSLINLRNVSESENQKNRKLNYNSRSGILGVYWCVKIRRWVARARVDGKQKVLGCFHSLEEAIALRQEANRLYGYHENHGCHANTPPRIAE